MVELGEGFKKLEFVNKFENKTRFLKLESNFPQIFS